MARGWESKSVADQIEESGSRAGERAPSTEHLPEDPLSRERLNSLKLSRVRTLDQLEHATNPAYRQMLGRTLKALEAEIEELTPSPKPDAKSPPGK